MTPGQRAEARIAELGIRDPKDLDVEAIAIDAGVSVRYAPLIGCEATLVGFGARAIATIRKSPVRGRERFSIGHELAHWELHRGKSFRCGVDEPALNLESNVALEREADEFASHLLMPRPLFNPVVRSFKWPTIAQIHEVAEVFQSSQAATMIRLAKVDTLPVIVACYSLEKRLWYCAAPHVPGRWRLKSMLDRDSFAHELLTRGAQTLVPRKQSADAWFENDDAEKHELLEQCVPGMPGRVMVTLYLSDEEMFEVGYDPDVKWRAR
ncbi:MAG TPA: ImmA/IrrE family metallo-endopeptidase [Steroidobacteraceae bacterium]|nr:ImmA/IrrE family metallo-endopeptidase [Steroidobacteraceae bacterium]